MALKRMLEWSPAQFDPQVIQQFIRFLGIYPVGSLVELESGRIAIVTEPTADLLRPNLLIVYSARHGHFVKPQPLSLESHRDERIVGIVPAARYGIDVADFI